MDDSNMALQNAPVAALSRPIRAASASSLCYTFAMTLTKLFLSSQGYVYLKFGSVEAASAAQQTLNGRFFAGRKVVAEFQFAHAYQQVRAVTTLPSH